MRIALLTYSTRPRGGVVHTLSLAEALAARGHDVTVWSLGRDDDLAFFRPVDPAVQLRIVPLPAVHGEGVGERVARSIALLGAAFEHVQARDSAYDVVHAQDCISANAVERCLRTVHHLDVFTTPQLVACHEQALRRPYAHVCVSRAVATELEHGWGLRATVIPNGVDAERFAAAAAPAAAPARRAWRERLGPYVLAVGGIEPRKGTLELVAAMGRLRGQLPGLRLVVAGGETMFDYRDYRRRFDEAVAELGLDVEVLGPVTHDRLPALVAGAAAFAFPSTREGFGLAAMEALAAGVPVVARDLPVLREVFGEAVAWARGVDELAARLADAVRGGGDPEPGRRLAARHTWAAAARAHEELYERLVS